MSVLVTGAAGFIGSKLVPRLEHGDNVVALDKADWDITDETHIDEIVEVLKRKEVEVCVHLAAIAAPRQAQNDPKLAWDTNVRGTHNVLTAAHRAGVKKFVFMSSAHVYGISPKYMPTDENHPLALHDTYTTTKIAGEELCKLFHSNYGLSTTILRLFNGYGPGQSLDYFMGAKLKQAAAGGPVTLMNAEVTKDWVYVDDIVKAIRLACFTEFVGPINIGTGIETSLAEITRIIAGAFGVEVVPETGFDGSPSRMCCDNGRAKRVLCWKPEVEIEEGLRKFIDSAR